MRWLCIQKPADTTSEPLTGNGQTGAPVKALGHLEKMLSHRDGGSFSPMLPHKSSKYTKYSFGFVARLELKSLAPRQKILFPKCP